MLKISFNFNKLRHYNRTVDTFQMSLILNIFWSKYLIIYLYYIYKHLYHFLKDNFLCIMYNDFMHRIQKSLDYNLINMMYKLIQHFFYFLFYPKIIASTFTFSLSFHDYVFLYLLDFTSSTDDIRSQIPIQIFYFNCDFILRKIF